MVLAASGTRMAWPCSSSPQDHSTCQKS